MGTITKEVEGKRMNKKIKKKKENKIELNETTAKAILVGLGVMIIAKILKDI